MEYRLKIATDGAAFEGENCSDELARILRKAATALDAELVEAGDKWRLFDINGNQCGDAEYGDATSTTAGAGVVEREMKIRLRYRRLEDRSHSEVFVLCAALARIRPDLPPHLLALDARELARLGDALSGLAVQYCNHGLTDRQETRRNTLERQATEIASFYGLKVNAGGDPRGYVLKLFGKGLPDNSMGGGFGIA